MKAYFKASLIAIGLLFTTFSAHASLIAEDTLTGTGSLGSYSAHFTWDGNTLNLDLTNLSDPSNGGYITGLLLNLPTGNTFNDTSSDTHLLALLPSNHGYNGAPYGRFDYGYALKGNFLGGSKPDDGIAVGNTGHFEFSDWSNAENFDIQDAFLNLATLDENDTNLLVRFKGFNNGGTDKVLATYLPSTDGSDDPSSLEPPLPSVEASLPNTLWLILLAALAAFFIYRKHKPNRI